MSEEKNLTKCKICGTLKMRIQDGKYNERNKRWVDEAGKQWNGHKCPTCVVEISRDNMRKKRKDICFDPIAEAEKK